VGELLDLALGEEEGVIWGVDRAPYRVYVVKNAEAAA